MSIKGAVMVPHPPVIIPEVGCGRESEIRKTIDAYQYAAGKVAEWRPQTVVVISPHSVMYADYFHISPGYSSYGNFAQFGAAQVKLETEYDTEFVRILSEETQKAGIPAGTLGERDRNLDHGTMVPLYFLNQCSNHYRTVRIGLSGLSLSEHYRLGMCIQQASNKLGRDTAVIASGDLSHKLKPDGPYGFQKEGPEYDRKIMDVMGRGAFGELLDFQEGFCEKAAECGHRSFTIMAGAFDGIRVKTEKVSYEGTFGVGYGICIFEPEGKTADPDRYFLARYRKKILDDAAQKRDLEDKYVYLARIAAEVYVKTGQRISVPDGLPDEMYSRQAGVFVSLHKEDRLRGCIGTISASEDSIAQEIISNAISAASRDPRFDPVREEELPELIYSVDVLGPAEEIDGPEELDVKRYGVIVTKGQKRGLLLPDLDGVDTVQYQISIAKRKAGIPEWVQDVCLERFEVVRHF